MNSPRTGAAGKMFVLFVASAVVLAGLLFLLIRPHSQKTTLHVYCAPAIRKPVESVAREYEKAYGVTLELDFGHSQALLTRLEISHTGDVFIPADDSYIEQAKSKDLVGQVFPLAKMKPIIAVSKRNPKQIHGFADLLRDDVRVSAAEAGAAIHRVVEEALIKSGDWPKLSGKVLSNGTVSDVANSVKLEAVDAGFIWDAMLGQYPTLEAVKITELAAAEGHVAVAVLKSTKQADAATQFAKYLAASDRGLLQFKQDGYEAVQGPPWDGRRQ